MLDQLLTAYEYISSALSYDSHFDKNYVNELKEDVDFLKYYRETYDFWEEPHKDDLFIFESLYQKYADSYCPSVHFDSYLSYFSKSRRQQYFFYRLEIDTLLELEGNSYPIDKMV